MPIKNEDMFNTFIFIYMNKNTLGLYLYTFVYEKKPYFSEM